MAARAVGEGQHVEFTYLEPEWTTNDALPGNHFWRRLPPTQQNRYQHGEMVLYHGDVMAGRFFPFRLESEVPVQGGCHLWRHRGSGTRILTRVVAEGSLALACTAEMRPDMITFFFRSPVSGNLVCQLAWPVNLKLSGSQLMRLARGECLRRGVMHSPQWVVILGADNYRLNNEDMVWKAPKVSATKIYFGSGRRKINQKTHLKHRTMKLVKCTFRI